MTETPPPEAARWWTPVCAESELGDPPLPVRALGVDLVLWRHGAAASGGVAAFDDRCPHRGARLSLGRVVGDTLQCAYHGWCFGADGGCRRVPALPGFVPPAGHAAPAWQVAAAHGLLWVARAPRGAAPPALTGVPGRRVVCGPYVVETSAPRVIENFLDTSHFAFVHEGWLGDAEHPEVPDHRVGATPDGRPCIDDYRTWQPRAAASAAGGAWVVYRYEVLAPFAALLVKQPQADAVSAVQDAYAALACPLDEERTRVWFLQFTSDTATSDEALQSFQDTIFAQDRPVLESQRPRRLPLQRSLGGGELHGAADRLSAAYRRWLVGQGIDYGVC